MQWSIDQSEQDSGSKATIFRALASNPSKMLKEEGMAILKELLRDKYSKKSLPLLGIKDNSDLHKYNIDLCRFFNEITSNEEVKQDLPDHLV